MRTPIERAGNLQARIVNKLDRPWLWGVLSFAWMAVIYALSDRPAVDYDGVDDATSWLPFASSIAHVGLYFVLSMFVFRTITATKRLGFGMTAYLTLFTALAFGVLDELHQSNVEGRASEATDVVADVFGAVLVVVFWFGLRKYRWNASG